MSIRLGLSARPISIVLALLVSNGAARLAAGQRSAAALRCYRFDSAYFVAQVAWPTVRSARVVQR
jgi:hypothetical protein